MWASAQNPVENKAPAERDSKIPWVVLSLVAHGLILAWLIYLVPATELASFAENGSNTQSPAGASASPERVQEVARQIEATQAEEIQGKIQELLDTKEALTELEEKKTMEFSALASELAAEAPQRALDAQAAATEAQAQAAQAEAEALKLADDVQKANEASKASVTPEEKAAAEAARIDAIAKAREAQDKAKDAQGKAIAAQTTVNQQLGFREDKVFEEAKTVLAEAVLSQEEANRKQDEAAQKMAENGSLKRAEIRASEALARAHKNVELNENRLNTVKEGAAKLDTMLAEQQAKLDQTKQQAGANMAKELDRIGKTISSTQERVKKNKEDLAKTEAKLAEAQAAIAPVEAELAKLGKSLETAPALAQSAQAAALEAQKKAQSLHAKVQSEMAKATGIPAESPSSASSSSTPRTEDAGQRPTLEGKSFAELYQLAVETEKQNAEQFQTIRATQVAVQRKIPISEARKYVEIAVPTREAFEAPAEGSVKDAAGLEAQNESMQKAIQQLESMVALSRNMTFQANNAGGSASSQGVTVSVEDMKAMAAQAEALNAMATEAEGQTAVDLTEMMMQMQTGTFTSDMGQAGMEMAGGEASAGSAGESPGAGMDRPGNGGSGPVGPQSVVAGQGVTGKGTGQGRFRAGGPEGLPAAGAVLNSVPGRKVHNTGTGTGSKWMFLDTWYIIGPFPNPQRRNIETKFPPESVVDLDANYQVDGGVLRWQFTQNAEAAIHPPLERPYAIYYAYTTLWFDDACGMWIAVGSDDYSKIWINDMPVWASGPIQKAWRANEGYRKVYFKKGLNRVLYRIENGQNACMFSMMLNMHSN